MTSDGCATMPQLEETPPTLGTATKTKKVKLLAISGKMGVGKSTVAGYISTWDDASALMPLAGPLKATVATMFTYFNCAVNMWKKPTSLNVRKVLQSVGAAVREIRPSAFVDMLVQDVAYQQWENGISPL